MVDCLVEWLVAYSVEQRVWMTAEWLDHPKVVKLEKTLAGQMAAYWELWLVAWTDLMSVTRRVQHSAEHLVHQWVAPSVAQSVGWMVHK